MSNNVRYLLGIFKMDVFMNKRNRKFHSDFEWCTAHGGVFTLSKPIIQKCYCVHNSIEELMYEKKLCYCYSHFIIIV